MRESARSSGLQIGNAFPDIRLDPEDITPSLKSLPPLLDHIDVVGRHRLGLQEDQPEQSHLAGIEALTTEARMGGEINDGLVGNGLDHRCAKTGHRIKFGGGQEALLLIGVKGHLISIPSFSGASGYQDISLASPPDEATVRLQR